MPNLEDPSSLPIETLATNPHLEVFEFFKHDMGALHKMVSKATEHLAAYGAGRAPMDRMKTWLTKELTAPSQVTRDALDAATQRFVTEGLIGASATTRENSKRNLEDLNMALCAAYHDLQNDVFKLYVGHDQPIRYLGFVLGYALKTPKDKLQDVFTNPETKEYRAIALLAQRLYKELPENPDTLNKVIISMIEDLRLPNLAAPDIKS